MFKLNKHLIILIHRIREIRILIEQGIPLIQALDILSEDESSDKKGDIRKFKSSLEQGMAFLDALHTLLPSLPAPITLVGAPPNLGIFLERYEKYLDAKRLHLLSLFKQLTYPLVLLGFILTLLFILIYFFIPNLTSLNVNHDTSALNTLLFFLQKVHDHFYFIILIGLSAASLIGGLFFQKCRTLFFTFFFPFSLSDYLWILSALIQSGISFMTVQNYFLTHTPNHVFSKNYASFKEAFIKTGDFSESLQQSFNLSRYHYELLKIGEKSGEFSKFLHLIANDLRKREEERTQIIINRIQPLLLCMIGFLIFMIMYLLFVPMLKLSLDAL